MIYNLQDKNIFDEDEKDLGGIIKFLDTEYGLVDDCVYTLLKDLEYYDRSEKRKIEDKIECEVEKHFVTFFSSNKEVHSSDLDEEVSKWIESFEDHASELKEITTDYIGSIFKKKTAGGIDMFKNAKEAKMFTAHLDALASEIEVLEDISPDMKTHLAYRLDRLSDLIEKSASVDSMFETEVLDHDKDEKYMREYNTDISEEVSKLANEDDDEDEDEMERKADLLEGNKDEKYMNQFNTDLHEEVQDMKDVKVDDGADMEALAIYVKKAMESLL